MHSKKSLCHIGKWLKSQMGKYKPIPRQYQPANQTVVASGPSGCVQMAVGALEITRWGFSGTGGKTEPFVLRTREGP